MMISRTWLSFLACLAFSAAAMAQTGAGVNLLGAGSQPPAGNVAQGQNNYPAMGFGLSKGGVAGAVTFTGLILRTNLAHNAQASDIVAIRLARDTNLNGVIDAGEVIASNTVISFPMTFGGFSTVQGIPNAPQFNLYIIGVDVAAAAVPGRIISLQILNNTDVTVNPLTAVTGAPVAGNNHTITAASSAEIDIQRPVGTSIPSGNTDNVGNVQVSTPTQFGYRILNTDNTASLNLTGTPLVNIPAISVVNCSAIVTTPPTTPVTPLGFTGFVVEITPSSAAAFSFSMVIANNDSNENPYIVNVQGMGVAAPVPSITVSTTTLNLGATSQGTAGTPATYTVSGSNLTANISISAPTGVELSSTAAAGPYTAGLTLVQSGGTVATTTIYARITSSAAVGAVSGNITHTSTGATQRDVAVSGTVNAIAPEMDVTRGATPIPDNTPPDALGTVASGVPQTVTYTITNSGSAALNLTGTTLVVVTPVSNITSATVTTQPANTVAALASTSFTVTYTITSAAAFSFTISIDNNDASENPYNWTVSGTGAAGVPELDVSRGASPVLSGSTDSVGNVPSGSASPVSYTLENNGSAVLNISAAGATAGTNCTVSVTTAAPATIAAAGSAPFVVSVTPLAPGAFNFTVTITNDDPNESTYTFTVSGTATVGGGGGGGGGSSSGGCSTSEENALVLVAAALAMCIFAMRRRSLA